MDLFSITLVDFDFDRLVQARLDAMEKNDDELAATTEEEEGEPPEPPVEFFDVCSNGGKPRKARTFTTD